MMRVHEGFTNQQRKCLRVYQPAIIGGSFFPDIFVWGSCFCFCIPSAPPPILLPLLGHLLRTTLSHTTLSHTILHCHTQLCHTPSLVTHNFVTHNPSLSHTTCSHTIIVTHNFVTRHLWSHTTLSHTILHCHTQLVHTPSLSHTTLSHAIFGHTQLCHIQLCHTHATFSHTILHCHTHVTHHFVTHTQLCHIQLCDTPLCHTPSSLSHTQLCHTQLCYTPAWQACQCPPSFYVAGVVALMGLVARLVAVGRPGRRGTLHGRRGTWRHVTLRGRRGTCSHRPSFCVAGVALLALGWVWWRAWSPLVARGAAALCMAGVALGDIHRHFPWQAWHVATSTFVLRGRRGPW